jgi:hypothetical protein
MKMSLKLMMLALACGPVVHAEEAVQALQAQDVTVEIVVTSEPDAVTQLQVDCAQLQQKINQHLRNTKIAGSVCAISSGVTLLAVARQKLANLIYANYAQDQGIKDDAPYLIRECYVPCEALVHRTLCCEWGDDAPRSEKLFNITRPGLSIVAVIPAVASGVITAVQYKKYKQAKQVLAAKQAELAKLLVSQDLVAAEQGDETTVL